MSRRETTNWRRVTVLAATLLGVAVGAGTLTSCANNEPEPQAQEQQEQQDPAPEPEPAKEETPEGPELPDNLDNDYTRAVLEYYDEYNKALESGEPDGFLALAEDCGSCDGMARAVEKVHTNGGHFEGTLTPVLDSDKNLVRQGTDTTANVSLRFEDSILIYPTADSEPEEPPTPFVDVHVNLTREGNTWLIQEITTDQVAE